MKSHKGYTQQAYGSRKAPSKESANRTSTGVRVDRVGLMMAFGSQAAETGGFVRDDEEIYPLGGRGER